MLGLLSLHHSSHSDVDLLRPTDRQGREGREGGGAALGEQIVYSVVEISEQ